MFSICHSKYKFSRSRDREMAEQGPGGGYSGWLGGYAKSVAGSVTAFTADILEETRQDTQGI